MTEWDEKEYIPSKRRGKYLMIALATGIMAWGILYYGITDQDYVDITVGYVFVLFAVLTVFLLFLDRKPSYKLTPEGIWYPNVGTISWTSIECLNMITDHGSGRTIPRTKLYSVRIELRDLEFLKSNNVKARVAKYILKH